MSDKGGGMISDRHLVEVLMSLAALNTVVNLILTRGVCNMSQATDAYNASVAQLTQDVNALIASGGSGGGAAAAVDAFATAAKAQIDTIDSAVKAATPVPPGSVAIPNVAGMTQSAASAALVAAGFTVGAINVVSGSGVSSGLVISTNPAAGAMALGGSAVAINLAA